MLGRDRAQRYADRRKRPRGSFNPTQLSSIAAWLRLQASSQSAGEWTNWVDVLNSNPMAFNVARRPAVAAAANGLPVATFLTNDIGVWPIAASNNNRNTVGYFEWAKPVGVTGTQDLLSIWNGSGGSSDRQILSFFSGINWVVILQTDATHGRQATVVSAASAGVWRCYGIEFDSSGSGDACLTLSIDGVIQSPTMAASPNGDGPLGTLTAVTGNIIVPNFQDGAAASHLDGDLGPNLFALTSKMAGASTGQLLTAAARAAIAAFERPT